MSNSTPWSDHPPVDLNYEVFKPSVNHDSKRPIVIVPGIVSTAKDWIELAEMMGERTGRVVFVTEPRNHGHSPDAESHLYQDMAAGEGGGLSCCCCFYSQSEY